MVFLTLFGTWLLAFAIFRSPARWVGRWIASQTKNQFLAVSTCVVIAHLVVVAFLGLLVLAEPPFLPHVNADPKGFGFFFASVLLFLPALLALILGLRQARSVGPEPSAIASPAAVPQRETNPVKHFVRSIPFPLLCAIIGAPAFGVVDLVAGKFFSQFMSDVQVAALLSSVMGALAGYLVGWYLMRKIGLTVHANGYDIEAAGRAKQENVGRR